MENEIMSDVPQSEEQADALLESIERPSHEQEPEQEAAPVVSDEFDLTVGGKQIKAKRDDVLKWASMGYDAPNQIGRLNKELESWKQKESRIKEYETKYGPVDEYVRQNPQFWDHVMRSFEQRNQILGDQSNPMSTIVSDLQKQVQDLVQYKNTVEERQKSYQMAQEDQALDQEYDQLKKSYPQVDFAALDESGRTLEQRVLQYAVDNGIKKLTTAFRDFYHDDLRKLYEEGAKERLTKEKMKNTKLGILGITPTPTKRASNDHRGKSYDDLTKEIIEEFKLS